LRTVRSEVSVLDAKHNQLDTDVNVMLGIDTGFAAVVGIIAADVHLGFAKAMATLDSEILARE
jgi:hypothetical protein